MHTYSYTNQFSKTTQYNDSLT